jgi:hypothetical protein
MVLNVFKSPPLFLSLGHMKSFHISAFFFFVTSVGGITILQKLYSSTRLAFFISQKILYVECDLNFDRHFIKNIFMMFESSMFYHIGGR